MNGVFIKPREGFRWASYPNWVARRPSMSFVWLRHQ